MAENGKTTLAPGVRADVDYQVRSYRYLRIGIVGLLVGLGSAVVYQRLQPACGLSSVSAYYYTPARSLFVGGLIGLGVGMLALRGMNLAEDVFLNLGGMFAFMVAFVPTGGGTGPCQDPDTRVGPSVQDNVTALLIVAILVIAGGFLFLAIAWKRLGNAYRWWALAEGIAALALWAAALTAIEFYLSWALRYVHYISAISLAACIIAVAAANAFPRGDGSAKTGNRTSPVRRPLYAWIAIVMVVISGVMIGLAISNKITLFWVEISIAGMFALFWGAQTVQLEVENRAASQAAEPEPRAKELA